MWVPRSIRAASALVCLTALLSACSSSDNRPDGSLPPNPCAMNNGGCDLNAICVVEPDGGPGCQCLPGYVDTGDSCVMEGDCSSDSTICDPNATCMDTSGSGTFACVCNDGYSGDGMTCTAATGACATNNGGCDAHASCQDNNGSPVCTCNTGYAGNGTTCTPAGGGSCSVNNGGCDPNATCKDTASGVTCTCNVGYSGNGMMCRATPVGGLGSPCSGGNMGNPPVQGSCPLGEDCLAISPMNMCTVVGCRSNADCGVSGVVQNVCTASGGVTFCLLSCDPNMSDPCGRSDFVCYTTTASTGAIEHVCVPDCRVQNVCPYPDQCDMNSGQCATVACGQNNSCPANQVCYTPPMGGNACVADCRITGNSCPSGYMCNSGGGCDVIPMQQAYQPCGGSNGMCAPGLGCVQDQSTGVAVCMKECNANSDCPANNEHLGDCGIQIGSGQKYCDDTCVYGTPCPSGTMCTDPATDNNGVPFCLP